MDLTEFTDRCHEVWVDIQHHAADVEQTMMAPSNRGWLVFGIISRPEISGHAAMMRQGVVPLVKPEETAEAWQPLFSELDITCAMLMMPAVVYDLTLRTHVDALIAVLHHPDQSPQQKVWAVRVLEDNTCEPFPALDEVTEMVPLGGDWMSRLLR